MCTRVCKEALPAQLQQSIQLKQRAIADIDVQLCLTSLTTRQLASRALATPSRPDQTGFFQYV